MRLACPSQPSATSWSFLPVASIVAWKKTSFYCKDSILLTRLNLPSEQRAEHLYLILSQLPGTIPSSRAGNPCWTNFFWASLPAVLRMFDNWTQAEAPRGHGWDSMGPALNLRKDNCNSGSWVADGTLLEFCPSFLDFSTVSTFIIFSMDQSEYITQ